MPERENRLAQGKPTLSQCVRAGVVPEGEAGQDASRFELAQARRKHVRPHPEVSLQIPVPLRSVEQPLHDEESPPCSDDFEGSGEVAHVLGSVPGFIQNGE